MQIGIRKYLEDTSRLITKKHLDRDPSRWNLGKEAIDMRRRIFWEMFKMDTWQVLNHTIEYRFERNG